MNRYEIFTIDGVTFRADFHSIIPDDDHGIDKFDNKWILYRFTYHKSTWMRKLKRKRSEQIPREKRVGIFDTLDQCKEAATKEANRR